MVSNARKEKSGADEEGVTLTHYHRTLSQEYEAPTTTQDSLSLAAPKRTTDKTLGRGEGNTEGQAGAARLLATPPWGRSTPALCYRQK